MYYKATEDAYLCDFNFDIHLRLLFAIGLLSGFPFIPIKNLCIIPWFTKHHLVVLDTALMITCSKYYGMYVLRLYIMELKLHVANIMVCMFYVCTLWN
jgi:hypothetical protein